MKLIGSEISEDWLRTDTTMQSCSISLSNEKKIW